MGRAASLPNDHFHADNENQVIFLAQVAGCRSSKLAGCLEGGAPKHPKCETSSGWPASGSDLQVTLMVFHHGPFPDTPYRKTIPGHSMYAIYYIGVVSGVNVCKYGIHGVFGIY